ncbi:hypothetical protein GDO78_005193 [Eleutherodactylus coqui]|uniref:Uncharacterized protein n=1 Tax=Eleutherodactylus coqui TaxID=57060 RepID=A0A8J6FK46_ELECQ|nr:hypothetical protein GDO78_005193 [Eleutherodactylus coqui]
MPLPMRLRLQKWRDSKGCCSLVRFLAKTGLPALKCSFRRKQMRKWMKTQL